MAVSGFFSGGRYTHKNGHETGDQHFSLGYHPITSDPPIFRILSAKTQKMRRLTTNGGPSKTCRRVKDDQHLPFGIWGPQRKNPTRSDSFPEKFLGFKPRGETTFGSDALDPSKDVESFEPKFIISIQSACVYGWFGVQC